MFHHVPSPPVDRALTHRALSRSPEGPACSALANGEATSGGEKSGEAVEESGRCEGASTESTRQPSHRRSRRVNHPTGGQTCLFDSFCWGHDFSSHDVLGAGRPGSVNPKQNPSRAQPETGLSLGTRVEWGGDWGHHGSPKMQSSLLGDGGWSDCNEVICGIFLAVRAAVRRMTWASPGFWTRSTRRMTRLLSTQARLSNRKCEYTIVHVFLGVIYFF